MRRRLLCVMTALLLVPTILAAQDVRVAGRVTDDGGAPLEGAQVSVKGTLNYVLTDADGRYVLRGVRSGTTLSFRLLGYGEVEAPAPESGSLDVSLPTGITMSTLYVVGTRRLDRSAVTTPVPVDIIPLDEVTGAQAPLTLSNSENFDVLDMTLEEAYNTQFPALETMRRSNDSREGVLAFVEHRRPDWTGT